MRDLPAGLQVDDTLGGRREVPHRPRDTRDLGRDHALDVTGLDGFHELAVAVAIGIRTRLLVGIQFDSGGFDIEAIGGVLAGAFALAGE